MKSIADLSVRDLNLLSGLSRFSSLRSFAKAENMTAANLSKVVKNLEHMFGHEIIVRSSVGVSLTHEGSRLSKMAKGILENIENLYNSSSKGSLKSMDKFLTIGSRGYLNTIMASPIIDYFEWREISKGVRFIDLSPDEVVESARKGILEVTVDFERINLGSLWETVMVGQCEWKLFGRKGHPLLRDEEEKRNFSNYYLVRPSYWDGDSVVHIDDGVPIEDRSKRYGHQAQNAGTAIQIALNSDQLVYLPEIAAKSAVESQGLKTIDAPHIKKLKRPLYLSVHKDKVNNRVFQGLRTVLKELL